MVFELITTLPEGAWASAPVAATNTAAIQMEESREKTPRGKVVLVFMAILMVGTRRSGATDSTAFGTQACWRTAARLAERDPAKLHNQ